MFFFEKKNQKTFATLTRLVGTGRDSGESFLLLFFKKEALLPPPMPEPHIIIPPPEATGQRADRFLAEAIGTLSRSRIKTLIESGHATRDGTLFTQPADPIRPGATYTITPPDPVSAIPQAQSIPFTILFEDRHLIVLDKPAGLVVHPAPGNQEGTLVNALLAHCGDTLPGIGGERRPGIVHRLDRDTSGVMVVAKTEQALASLSAAFAARDIERLYKALVWGIPNPAEGEIEGAIGRDPRDRKRMALVTKGGKPALTRYRITAVHHAAACLLECRLATGRTHQIRVHLAASGHPVVGDPVYLRRIPAISRAVPEPQRGRLLDFPRQALHAATLGFRHPATGADLRFETPLPADFQALLTAISPT
jgi:23S rRNA pseudouridine1911/1915/1917 synthase